METYDLTLRFDDQQHLLTAQDGLPIEDVAKLLASLSQALALNKDQKVVLSEIRGNCYALNLSTSSVTVHETLKVIHRKVSENDFKGLTTAERQYASTLKTLLGDELTLDVYDKTKEFKVRVTEVKMPSLPQFYYQITVVTGVITSIGGQTIEGASYIIISQYSFQIKVNSQQEAELINHFKRDRIRFTLKKKIRVDNDATVSAELESFEVLSNESFTALAEKVRNKYPEGIFSDEEDAVDLIRKLRD